MKNTQRKSPADFEKIGKPGYYPFDATRESPYYFGENCLVIMRGDDGHESSPHIFTLWNKNNNHYSLQTILDTTMYYFYSSFDNLNVISLKDSSHLVIALSSGADGDYGWGDFWLGSFSNSNNKLKIMYHTKCEGNIVKGEILKYKLEQNMSRIILDRVYYEDIETEGQSDWIRKDSLISRDTIFYEELIIDKGKN